MKGCTIVCGGTRRGRKTKMLVETVRPALREGFPPQATGEPGGSGGD